MLSEGGEEVRKNTRFAYVRGGGFLMGPTLVCVSAETRVIGPVFHVSTAGHCVA